LTKCQNITNPYTLLLYINTISFLGKNKGAVTFKVTALFPFTST